jgi:hypothetical protein
LAEESNISADFISKCVVYKLLPRNYKNGKKRLNAFLAICNEKPKDIKCVSTFTDSYGNDLPEFDKLQWVNVDSIDENFPIHLTQYESYLEAMEVINKSHND